ncbi:MAG: patatin-like phospholipase family protein [Oscillochloris sp.]|nr:patatin-like phospholipase family protein [Oscillochloris sp.]
MGQRTALVLSGGGARGAYHIGAIEALIEAGWMRDGVGPDILAGTSIGALNAAALASGCSIHTLRSAWLEMHTEDVHRLSPDLPALARPLAHFLLRSVLTSEAHGGSIGYELPLDEREQNDQTILGRLGELFRSRPFRSLLDTQPWRQTLARWMDFERINSAAAPALLVTATELQSGRLEVFCNRALNGRPADKLTIDHLMASASIPAIYPWTSIGDGKYWDGAVLANTPLDPVIDLAGDDDLDILVVMMTPWSSDGTQQRLTTPPQDLMQAMSLTLDWAMLASYRVAFENLRQRNRMAAAGEQLRRAAALTGDVSLLLAEAIPRPIQLPTVIAPREIMPLEWIVDYETANHERLFELGRQDALRALEARKP